MQHTFAHQAIAAVEARRMSLPGLSRAQLCRTAQLNDATISRGLRGPVRSRPSTAAQLASGLLEEIMQRAVRFSDGEQTVDALVMRAAANLAVEVRSYDLQVDGADGNFRKALGKLDSVMELLPTDHHRLAGSLRHLAHLYLDSPSQFLRLALIGAAGAVIEHWSDSMTELAAIA